MQWLRQFSKEQIGYALAAVLCLFAIGVWTLVYAQTPRGVLTVAVLDVGQGDSIYIEGPTGVKIILDGGPDDSLLRDLPTVMPPFDHSLDAIIESHPDADHIDGFIDLLKRYQVGAFIEPGIPKKTMTADTLMQEVLGEKIPRYIARRGMVLDVGGGAQLDILFPDFDTSHLDANSANEGAIVAHVVYGNTSLLLTADAPQDVETHLMQISTTSDLQSDILKVGHHGSRTSTGDAFVAEVHPRIAVISLGKNNKYHFPNPEPLNILVKYGAHILRTDQNGTVTCTSDGAAFVCE